MNAPLPTRAEEAREEQRLRDLQWLVAYLDHTCGVRPLAEEDLRRLINTEARAVNAEAEVARLTETLRSQCKELRDAWDEITRLTQERDAAIKVCDMNAMSGGFSARWAENATKRAEAAEARVAVLEGALKPFAEYAADMPGADFGEGEIGEYYHGGFRRSIRTQDLTAAIRALPAQGGEV